MSFFEKPVESLTEDDLQSLLGLKEGDTLEFKRDMYGKADKDVREMLRDISSMANHRGGHLIIGVDEHKDGSATTLLGVPPTKHVERITSSCLANIDKRIVGLKIQDVPLTNGNVVVVIAIPESFNAPHMITFQGGNDFWKRHGRQKSRMSLYEIEDTFRRVNESVGRVERFLEKRKQEILEEAEGRTCVMLCTVPANFTGQTVLDVSDQRLQLWMTELVAGWPYPTLMGRRTRFERDYLDVHRSGYIEWVTVIEPEEYGLKYPTLRGAQGIIQFCTTISNIYLTHLAATPIIIGFAIYNAKGLSLGLSREKQFLGSLHERNSAWPKQHLELGTVVVENLSSELKLVPKRLSDLLWNAFHFERALVFDAQGNLKS